MSIISTILTGIFGFIYQRYVAYKLKRMQQQEKEQRKVVDEERDKVKSFEEEMREMKQAFIDEVGV